MEEVISAVVENDWPLDVVLAAGASEARSNIQGPSQGEKRVVGFSKELCGSGSNKVEPYFWGEKDRSHWVGLREKDWPLNAQKVGIQSGTIG